MKIDQIVEMFNKDERRSAIFIAELFLQHKISLRKFKKLLKQLVNYFEVTND